MIRQRRVGTLSAGMIFVVFGIIFMTKVIFGYLNYMFILSLWPLILIILGLEILISYFAFKEESVKYDKGAIFLIVLLTLFSFAMAAAEVAVQQLEAYNIML